MPPKKNSTKAATSAGAGNDDGSGAFRWTLENEKKLLILTQGRYSTTEDYERLQSVFPGTTFNGIKNQKSRASACSSVTCSRSWGWDLPEGAAKRKAAGGEGETPVKKAKTPTKKKGKKSEEVVEEEEEDVCVKKEVGEDEATGEI